MVLTTNPAQDTIEAKGTFTLSGATVSSFAIDAAAYWATGSTYESGEPQYVTGTFTVGSTTSYFSTLTGKPQKPGTEPVAMTAEELAQGVFELVGTVAGKEDPTASSSGYPPAGVAVSWITVNQSVRVVLDGFVPKSGVSIDGELTISGNADGTYVAASGSFTLTGASVFTVSINGNATWTGGFTVVDSPPSSVSGTFTVDGVSLQLTDLIDLPDLPAVPPAHAEIAGNVFSLIGTVVSKEDPTTGNPAGMTVSASQTSITVTLSSYAIEPGVYVSGSMTMSVNSTQTELTINGSFTMTGGAVSSFSIYATAYWTGGATMSTGEPSSFSGTFTIGSATYQIADLIAMSD